MKKFVKIPLALALGAILSMGGLARGQTSEASKETGTPADPEFMSPAAAAFVYYFRIQSALAEDSLTNVVVNALALANAIRMDTSGAFPAQLAAQVDALARDAIMLPGARLDFAIVSGQLMNYLKVKKPPEDLLGPVRQVYDPVTRLYWLQLGGPVQNPYLGKSWTGRGTYSR